MPPEDILAVDDNPPSPDAGEKPAEQPFNAKEEFTALSRTLTDSLTNAFANIRVPAAAPAPSSGAAPTYDEPTEGEWEKAFADGDAKAVRALTARQANAAAKRAAYELKTTAIDPLQSLGLSSMSSMASQLARGDMEYYDDFKDEIDTRLAGLSPELRTDPTWIKRIHALVVGEHRKEIIKKEVEKTIRQMRDDPNAPLVPRGSRESLHASNEKPVDVTELIGGDAGRSSAIALKNKNMDFDAFARKFMGISGADYAKKFGTLPEQ